MVESANSTDGERSLPAPRYWFTGKAIAAFIVLLGAVVAAASTASLIGLLGAGVAVVGTVFGWYQSALSEQETETKKRETTAQRLKTERAKDLLGAALETGETFLSELRAKADTTRIEQQANVWAAKTKSMIAAAYGDGEAALFMDSSGLSFLGGTALQNGIDGRKRRLIDLLNRADTLSTRSSFDPSGF